MTEPPVHPDPGPGGSINLRDVNGAQIGAGNVQVNNFYGATGPVVRSLYLEQVRRIAPDVLIGREGELAELHRFCAAPDESSYAWWRADPWAGKSALMSWFVLHPPLGVDVISFFITARFAGQSTRLAFAEVILEQLCDLLGQPMPAFLTEATRDAHVLGSLADAAAFSHGRGRRLVLVVDGLDEDRGVTEGPDAYSIAALLPKRPVAGMRVIVAGRPNPPVPTDVPSDHPLRDQRIVRALARSPHALEIEREANQELRRLLSGNRLEQDILGFVAAAGGGLSAPDLAALTGEPEWQIDARLTAVTGRTFIPSTSTWRPAAPDVYLLGHENLQIAALDTLGPDRLAEYRGRIHDWADGYRQAGWPDSTPEYLLRGYYSLLVATGETTRMIGHATDARRHDRMMEATGADTAALAEIAAAQDHLLLFGHERDLGVLARLAQHRDLLAGRNANTPYALPSIWFLLGHVGRAEALARSIPDPYRQARALTALAVTARLTGDGARVGRFLDWAVAGTGKIDDPGRRVGALTELIAATAGTGRCAVVVEQAKGVLAHLPHSTRAELSIAEALAGGGELDQIDAFVARLFDRSLRARGLAARARAAVVAGRRREAAELLQRAAGATRGRPVSADKARTLAGMAWTARTLGSENADLILADAQKAASASTIPEPDRVEAQAALVGSVLTAWGAEKAWNLVYSMAEEERAGAFLTLIRHAVGDRDEADLDRAEVAARALPGIAGAEALALIAWRALTDADTDAGRRERAKELAYEAESLVRSAESAARAIVEPLGDVRAVVRLAEAAFEAGDLERARVLRREAADTLETEDQQVAAALVRLAARGGDATGARDLARRIPDSPLRTATVVDAAAVLASAGRWPDGARLLQLVPDDDQDPARTRIAQKALALGDPERAEQIASEIRTAEMRESVLGAVARVLAGAGQHERALELFAKIRSADRAVRVAQAAESAARSLLEAAVRNDDDTAAERLIDALPRLGSRVRMRLVRERARGRPVDLATVLPLVDSFGFPEQRAEAAIGLVPVVAASGQPEIARALADRVVEELRMITTPRRRDPIQVGLAAAVEESGDHDRALKIARAITGPNEKLTALMGLARSAARSGDAVRAGRLIELIQPAVRRHLDGARRDEFLLEMLEILADAAAITLDPRQGEAFADRAEEIGRAVDHRKIEAAARVVAVFAEAAAKAVDAVRANALGSRSAAVTQALPGSDIELADEIGQLSRRAMTDGHRKRAVTLAQHVTIPDRQAELLCELALLGPDAGAVELVGQAFRAGRWTIPMVAFAHISPDQFIEVVPQLLERHRPSRLQQEDAADRISELGS